MYHELFEEFDEDGSGNIDATELRNILEHAGRRVSSQEIAKIIEEIDDPANGGNGDGLVSEDEFLNLLANNGKNILAETTTTNAAERKLSATGGTQHGHTPKFRLMAAAGAVLLLLRCGGRLCSMQLGCC